MGWIEGTWGLGPQTRTRVTYLWERLSLSTAATHAMLRAGRYAPAWEQARVDGKFI